MSLLKNWWTCLFSFLLNELLNRNRKRRQQAIGTGQAPKPWQGPSTQWNWKRHMQPSTFQLTPKVRRFSAWFNGRLRRSKELFYESRCMRQDVWVHWDISILFGRKYCILIKTLLSWLDMICVLCMLSEKQILGSVLRSVSVPTAGA